MREFSGAEQAGRTRTRLLGEQEPIVALLEDLRKRQVAIRPQGFPRVDESAMVGIHIRYPQCPLAFREQQPLVEQQSLGSVIDKDWVRNHAVRRWLNPANVAPWKGRAKRERRAWEHN